MLLDIKRFFGTSDDPVTAALELDLSKISQDITVPGTVEGAHPTTLQGRA